MSSVSRALTAVATQSDNSPAYTPTHTCRSRVGEADVLKRRVAQEISLPWEPVKGDEERLRYRGDSWYACASAR